MSDSTEIESLSAQLLALQIAVSALLRSHPDPERVAAEIPVLAEVVRGMLLTTTFSDDALAKFEGALKLLLSDLQR